MYGYYTLDVDGTTSEGWIPENNVQVTLNLLPGPHTLTAYFRGYVTFFPASTSGPQTIITAKATPGIAADGALTVRSGQAHALAFTASGPAGAAIPTGSVQLKEGATVLGSSALSGGAATITTAALPRGAHDVVLTYSGDGLYDAAAINLTLSVLPNVPLAVDARGLQSAISIRAVLPQNTTGMMLQRRPAGTTSWTAVGSWPASEFDIGLTRGVLYEYRVEAIVDNALQWSNIDAALMFNDDTLPAASLIKRLHFDELRLSINALRAAAGLPAFDFDGTYPQGIVRASHLASMRNALTEARSALGMTTPAFTDPATTGTTIKKVHIQELREQAR